MSRLRVELRMMRASDADDPYAFRFAPQAYHVLEASGAVHSGHFPWDQRLLDDLAELGAGRWNEVGVARIGETLRRFLGETAWTEHERAIASATREGREVLVTITANAAELYALPWELLSVGASGLHLGALPGVAVRYAWPDVVATPPEPAPRPEGGRILFAWSAAGGALPTGEHREAIARACARGHHPDAEPLHELANVTLGRLRATLREAAAAGAPFAILHLLCHGAAEDGAFGLAFDDEDEGRAFVDGGRLRRVLAPYAGTLRLVVLSACQSAASGALASHLGSVAQSLHRAGVEAVVAARTPLSVSGSEVITRVLYRALLVELRSLEQALAAAREAVADAESTPDWAALQLYADPRQDDLRPVIFRPYRGLLAFHSEHRRLLFGRDQEIAELQGDLARLGERAAPRMIIVQGASGTGKSSAVLGGVVPALAAAKIPGWSWLRIRPGQAPTLALAVALSERLGAPVEASPAAIEAALAERSDPLLVVVDQLEELFTHVVDPDERAAFARLLWALASRPGGATSVIATLRIDFLGRCGELVLETESDLRLDRVAYADDHRVTIPQMTRDQLRQVIEGPARALGLELEHGLCARILDDVSGEPGALPAISYALDLLWASRRDGLLTQADYDALGGVAGALYGRADALVEGLDELALGQARRLLVKLVGIRRDAALDTRRRLPLAALRPPEGTDEDERAAFDRVLSTLVDARLLVRDEDPSQGATVEVAHEALIRRWDRLRRWVDADRERLAELARVEGWVQEWRSAGYLLHDTRLGYAEDVAARFPGALSADARAMIAASRAAFDAQRAELGRLLAEAERQRGIAEGRLADAIAIADDILRVIDGDLAEVPGATAVRKALLARTAAFQERLLEGAGESRPARRSRLDSHVNRGEIARTHDNLEVAEREFRAAVELGAALLREGDEAPVALSAARAEAGLADIEQALGESAAAEARFERAIAILRAHEAALPQARRQIATILTRIGYLAELRGDLRRSGEALRESFACAEAAHLAAPDDLEARVELAIAHEMRAGLAEAEDDPAAALAHFQAGLAIATSLLEGAPTSISYGALVFSLAHRLALFYILRGDAASGRPLAELAMERARALAEADPENQVHRHRLGVSHQCLAGCAQAAGDEDARGRHLEAFVAIISALVEADPEDTQARSALLSALNLQADYLSERGEVAPAAELRYRVLALGRELVAQQPSNRPLASIVFNTLVALGHAEVARGRLDVGLTIRREVAALLDQRLAASPDDVEALINRIQASLDLAGVEALRGDLRAARDHYVDARDRGDRLLASPHASRWDPRNHAVTSYNIAVLDGQLGDVSSARAHRRRFLEALHGLAAADPSWVRSQLRELLVVLRPALGSPGEAPSLHADLGIAMATIEALRAHVDADELAWDEAVCASMLGLSAATPAEAEPPLLRSLELIRRLSDAAPSLGALVSRFATEGNLVWHYHRSGAPEAALAHHQARLEILERLEREGLAGPDQLAQLRASLGGVAT
ncbi:MAG: CHAT domain-containing protein [Myxococcales bacterium]|nr:CHAT domain-containing protein [Myxococcales bacterium]